MNPRSLLLKIKKKYARRGLVLMYHRIIKIDTDPWDIAVSPQNFGEHLQVLKDYNVISLNKLEGILINKKHLPANTIAITFDDGYADNYLNAKPLLEKYNMPASFFITNDAFEKRQEFWWDVLERICLQSAHLPEELILNQPENIHFKISKQGNADTVTPQEVYLKLCEIARKLPADEMQLFIEQLKIWANNLQDRADYLTMTKTELLDLGSNPLFTVGAHTVTHPYLPNFSYEYQNKEIQGNIDYLEKLTGDKIKYLAYPHGGNNEFTLDIVAQSGLKLAFTTHSKCFYKNSDPYTIPRVQVIDQDGKTFASQLKNWMKYNR
ncbi:MAG: polysaccharide deacetylase [Mucilaginibacter sp.]|nr:polysaccharide deacetylase [Mucilaginibacter sp.]